MQGAATHRAASEPAIKCRNYLIFNHIKRSNHYA
nr:MAG TPA: hypothetical protein [Caudoviricetes sp.]